MNIHLDSALPRSGLHSPISQLFRNYVSDPETYGKLERFSQEYVVAIVDQNQRDNEIHDYTKHIKFRFKDDCQHQFVNFDSRADKHQDNTKRCREVVFISFPNYVLPPQVVGIGSSP